MVNYSEMMNGSKCDFVMREKYNVMVGSESRGSSECYIHICTMIHWKKKLWKFAWWNDFLGVSKAYVSPTRICRSLKREKLSRSSLESWIFRLFHAMCNDAMMHKTPVKPRDLPAPQHANDALSAKKLLNLMNFTFRLGCREIELSMQRSNWIQNARRKKLLRFLLVQIIFSPF